MRRIDIMALYQPQSCIHTEGKYITIKKVENRKDQRLSETRGNVNFTDYWFSMMDDAREQDFSYTCQYFTLLSDEDKEELDQWWMNKRGKYICFCFLKIRTDEERVTLEQVQKSLQELVAQEKKEQEKKKQEEKEQEEKDYEEGRCFRTIDNADIIFIFSATKQETIKKRLDAVKNLSVQNIKEVFFSNYSLYGLCDEEELKVYKCENVKDGGCQKHALYSGGWCGEISKMLKDKIENYEKVKNKKMMAYYRALLQIVNVIAQYEQEKILKDLFFIFYPPISLFLEQLEAGEADIAECNREIEWGNGDIKKNSRTMKYAKMQKMERAASEFLDSMELLLHHMGHSCPDILSESGRSGMPFDIPLRLCLMYIAFLNVLTDVLNDREEYEYQYCLAPLAYSRPTTKCFDFDLSPTNRLIRVQISRHTMFMPRSLLIILSHEASHYVGDKSRNRFLRAEVLVNILAMSLVLTLMPKEKLADFAGCLESELDAEEENYFIELQVKIYEYLSRELQRSLLHESRDIEEAFHFVNFMERMNNVYRDLLYDSDGLLNWEIEAVGRDRAVELRNSPYHKIKKMKNIQDSVKGEIQRLLTTPDFGEFMRAIGSVLKEVYSDLTAILLLDLSPTEFLETYIISESYTPDIDTINISLINRIAMVNETMCQGSDKWKQEWEAMDSKKLNDNPFLIELKRRIDQFQSASDKEEQHEAILTGAETEEGKLLSCNEIIAEERRYFDCCYKSIEEQLEESEKKKPGRKSLLRNLYKHFQVYEKEQDTSFTSFFNDYEALVKAFKKDVKEKWIKET